MTIDREERQPSPSRQASTGPSYLSYLALKSPVPSSDTTQASSASTTATVRPADRAPQREASSTYDVSRTSTPPPRTATPTQAGPIRARVVKRPSPRLYFAHFIDHREPFMHFLEIVALRRWGQSVSDANGNPSILESPSDVQAEEQDQAAVWNTLLELYLSPSKDSSDLTGKAMRLLKSSNLPYDPTHALILCSTRAFTPGLVLLWEKRGMYEDVLRFWMDKEKEDPSSGASQEVIRCLERYGSAHAHLYPLVLRFLTSSSELLSKHTGDVGRILEHINEEKIMPPLSVVQVLSRNGIASVGLMKQWLTNRIKETRQEVDTVRRLSAVPPSFTNLELLNFF